MNSKTAISESSDPRVALRKQRNAEEKAHADSTPEQHLARSKEHKDAAKKAERDDDDIKSTHHIMMASWHASQHIKKYDKRGKPMRIEESANGGEKKSVVTPNFSAEQKPQEKPKYGPAVKARLGKGMVRMNHQTSQWERVPEDELKEVQEIAEATELESGVELKPKSHDHHIYPNGRPKMAKAYDVHFNGEHIGHVVQTTTRSYRKNAADKVIWAKQHNSETAKKHGLPSDINHSSWHDHVSAKEAANSMARHYRDNGAKKRVSADELKEALAPSYSPKKISSKVSPADIARITRQNERQVRAGHSRRAHELSNRINEEHQDYVGTFSPDEEDHSKLRKLHADAATAHENAQKQYPESDFNHHIHKDLARHHSKMAAMFQGVHLKESVDAVGGGSMDKDGMYHFYINGVKHGYNPKTKMIHAGGNSGVIPKEASYHVAHAANDTQKHLASKFPHVL